MQKCISLGCFKALGGNYWASSWIVLANVLNLMAKNDLSHKKTVLGPTWNLLESWYQMHPRGIRQGALDASGRVPQCISQGSSDLIKISKSLALLFFN
jgi:hypothetical protein